MMSPQAQLTSPFFLGGVGGIIVSYPTDTMEFDARMQSMRGNSPGFSHGPAAVSWATERLEVGGADGEAIKSTNRTLTL
jgi:hypothetical protein